MSGPASVTLFCGSRLGTDPRFRQAAHDLGVGLAQSGRRLVYGGGRAGLMGVAADAALAAGGQVLGVIPEFLSHAELAHTGLSELVVTQTMHERKARLYAESEALIGLPGGIGTLDELIEAITWRHLRQHHKPVLICDIAGSAAPFLAMIDAVIALGFTGANVRDLFEIFPSVPALLARLDHLPEVTEPDAIAHF